MEKQCPNCGAQFQPWGSQRFCSKRCAKAYGYRQFKASGRYDAMKRQKREQSARIQGFNFSVCPYLSGAIKMPDGGRMPDAAWGY